MEPVIDYIVFSTQRRKPYFVVNNAYGDCGHRHRTAQAAQNCLKRIGRRKQGRYRFYCIKTRPEAISPKPLRRGRCIMKERPASED
jgi:hypothetical protein